MKIRIATLITLAVLAVGCASELAIREMGIDPNVVAVGSNAIITVTFTGTKGTVKSVRAIVREAPDIYYDLRDDGQNGDEKAGDNVWSVRVDVPMEAMTGTYNLDIRARDADGNTIQIKGNEATSDTFSGSITVAVS